MNSEKVVLCAFADEADGSLDGQIEALKANGISQLEIRFVDKKNIVSLTPDEAKEIKAKLDANGISVWSLGSPIGKIKIYVEYPNGATGTFITSTGDAPGANRFEIVCDGGTLVCEDNVLTLKKLEVAEPEFSKTNTVPFGTPKCTVTRIETDGQNPQHQGVRAAFVGAILRNEPFVADGREGINGLTISNAMHLSAWTGKPVELPFDEILYKDLLMEHVKTSRRKTEVSASVAADMSGTYNS